MKNNRRIQNGWPYGTKSFLFSIHVFFFLEPRIRGFETVLGIRSQKTKNESCDVFECIFCSMHNLARAVKRNFLLRFPLPINFKEMKS